MDTATRTNPPSRRKRRHVQRSQDDTTAAQPRRRPFGSPIRPYHIGLWLLGGTASAALSAWLALRASPLPSDLLLAPVVPPTPSERPMHGRSSSPGRRPGRTPPAAAEAPPRAEHGPAPSPTVTPEAASVGPASPPGGTAAVATALPHRESPVAGQALSDVAFVAESHGPQIRACYDRAFRHDPSAPSGRIELSFTLVDAGDFGRAMDIRPELNLLGDERVATCLIERVQEWRFPRPVGGHPQSVRYPFLFAAAEP